MTTFREDTAVNTATEKQIQFINRLKRERDLTLTAVSLDSDSPEARSQAARVALDVARDSWRSGTFTVEVASSVIDLLLAAPRPAAEFSTPEIEAGVYETEDNIYRVYHGQQSGRMLVSEVVSYDQKTPLYEYLGSAARFLPADARRLSLEEVGMLGKAFSHCLICGRRLDTPESVDRGLGPVCAKGY